MPAVPSPAARRGCTRRGLSTLGLAALAGSLLGPGAARAEDVAARARQVFAEVNQMLPRLQASRFAAQRPGAGYPASGRAWTQDGLPRKIEIVERDDSGDVVSEFFYADGALVFVFESVRGWRGTPARQVTVAEERLYYRDGRLVKWLSGMGSDKTDHTPGGADFNEAGRTRLAASAAFVAAARKALDVKR